MDSEFWKCFYVFDYKKHFLSCDPKKTIEDYIKQLENELKHFMEPENMECINKNKESLIEGLKKAIKELKTEDSK